MTSKRKFTTASVYLIYIKRNCIIQLLLMFCFSIVYVHKHQFPIAQHTQKSRNKQTISTRLNFLHGRKKSRPRKYFSSFPSFILLKSILLSSFSRKFFENRHFPVFQFFQFFQQEWAPCNS